MRNFTFSLLFLLLGVFFSTASAQGGAGIVNSFGRLQVANAHVCSENGTQVSLGGMSMFWSGWSSKYYTAATVDYLVDNFKVSVLRAAYGCPAGEGPQGDIADIQAVVNQCIARGIYVIIDWHIEGDNTPYEAQEISFFQSMVQQYGNYNNVLYELWNEPTSSSASTIQGVCQRVANAIRAKETQLGYSHKLVICGSNSWSQNPNSYSITDPNAAYTFHGYFDNQPHLGLLTSNAAAAMNQGNAVFVTEYGASYCNHSQTDQAIAWCQANKISMCAWSVNDKVEDWSIFTNNLDALTCVGSYYKGKISTWPTPNIVKVYPTAITIPATASVGTNGASTQLTPAFTPANSTETSTTWTSSNTAIATVNAAGVVTGHAAGTATITATTKNAAGGNLTSSCTVTVSANAWSAKIEAESYTYKTAAPASEACSDLGGGYNMGYIGNTDFMTYSVTVPTAGTYTISYRVASTSATGQVILGINGTDLTAPLTVPNTGGWQVWNTITTTASLPAGTTTYTVYAKTGGFNINWWSISGSTVVVPVTGVSVSPATVSVAAGSTVALAAAIAPSNASNTAVTWSSSNTAVATVSASGVVTGVAAGTAVVTATTADGSFTSSSTVTVTGSGFSPIHIEAETYNASGAGTGGSIQKESCSDAGGGQDVGYISTGCWFSYPTITIPQTATYTISYRVASPNSGLTFNLSSGSTTLDANVPVPNTGGWQNWQTVSRQVSLTAGTYNMAFGYFTGAVNINWFEISNPLKSGAVSNEKVASEASVRFYPNPAESELHVESSLNDINEIAVYTLSGVQIEKVVLNSVDSYQMNVASLATGMYILKISTKDAVSIQRFVKK